MRTHINYQGDAELLRLYEVNKYSTTKIAQMWNTSPASVWRLLRRAGIPRRSSGGRIKDLAGRRFTRLCVIENAKKRIGKQVTWLCQCDCGNLTEVTGSNLRQAITRSCGCLQAEIASSNMQAGVKHPAFKHGDSRSLLYGVLVSMIQRCYNPNAMGFKYYGDRGIKVCDEWRNSYVAFREWARANGYKLGLTIDRINSDGDYEPSNCQWITRSENTKKIHRKEK